MNLFEMISAELRQEAGTTRKLLERVPADSFAWKPHEKSMTMGDLAAHIANLHQTWLLTTLTEDEFDLAESRPPRFESLAEILAAFDQSVARADELLRTQTDDSLFAAWRLKRGDEVLFELPRWRVFRSMISNHIIHHRGQLSVYLRLRDVSLPPIYGPTADEAPAFQKTKHGETKSSEPEGGTGVGKTILQGGESGD